MRLIQEILFENPWPLWGVQAVIIAGLSGFLFRLRLRPSRERKKLLQDIEKMSPGEKLDREIDRFWDGGDSSVVFHPGLHGRLYSSNSENHG